MYLHNSAILYLDFYHIIKSMDSWNSLLQWESWLDNIAAVWSLGKSLNFFLPQFSHLWHEVNNIYNSGDSEGYIK